MQSKAPLIYVRVSTDGQRQTGTSIESQLTVIDEYLRDNQLHVDAQDRYTEVASGLRPNQLTRSGALGEVYRRAVDEQRAILVTRFDRLTRSMEVLEQVFDAGITIIEAQNNDEISRNRATSYLNRTTQEREKKRKSQQAAYDKKRASGETMGNPDIEAVQKLGAAAVKDKAEKFMRDVMPSIEPLLEQGMNPNQIANELNKKGVPTRRGAKWSRNNVVNLLERRNAGEIEVAIKSSPNRSIPDAYSNNPDYGRFA